MNDQEFHSYHTESKNIYSSIVTQLFQNKYEEIPVKTTENSLLPSNNASISILKDKIYCQFLKMEVQKRWRQKVNINNLNFQ